MIACLPALTGDHDRPAGGLCYSTSKVYGFDRVALHRPDLRTGNGRLLIMTQMAEHLLRAEPPVESILIFGANPVVSNPDQRAVRQALEREDLFTVVIDHLQTPTAAYADLLLPSTTQIEQFELLRSYGHLFVHWNEPAVAPRGESLPHTEIFRRLATGLGIDEPAVYASDLELADAALGDHPSMAGITLDRLRAEGFARLAVGMPYAEHAERFATPSGRFEFTSSAAESWGHGALPVYVPAAEASVDVEGTFALLAPAGAGQLNSIFGGDKAQPPLRLHPADAASAGIAPNDRVRVSNGRGSFEIDVEISDDVRIGTAVTEKGYWPTLGGDSVNATTTEEASDMGFGARFHDNRVTITKVSPIDAPTASGTADDT